MARAPILAAGGIVIRGGARPLIAVVQRRKDNGWVLPKGKLKRKERAITAARREVMEETGHKVSVQEFLGVVSYNASSRLKIVQFWKMQAVGGPVAKLTRDIRAVEWLPIPAALKRLSHPLERAFLDNVQRQAIKLGEPPRAKQRRPVRMDRTARKPAAAGQRAVAHAPSPRLSRFRQIMASFWTEAAGVVPSMPK